MKLYERQTGFTITELLVVIGIIALMGTLAIPATVAMVESHRRTAARNLIRTALAQARAHAAQSQKYTGVRFQYDAAGWKNGRQYMVLIEHNQTYYYPPSGPIDSLPDCYIAVSNAKPLALPNGMGVIALDTINPDPSFEADNNNNLDDDEVYNDGGILKASTFSIIFSPTGQLVVKDVKVYNRDQYDNIFGSEANSANKDVLFSYDNHWSPSGSVGAAPWCESENSTTGLYIFETSRMAEVNPAARYSEYVRTLKKPLLINIYTGQLIDEEF